MVLLFQEVHNPADKQTNSTKNMISLATLINPCLVPRILINGCIFIFQNLRLFFFKFFKSSNHSNWVVGLILFFLPTACIIHHTSLFTFSAVASGSVVSVGHSRTFPHLFCTHSSLPVGLYYLMGLWPLLRTMLYSCFLAFCKSRSSTNLTTRYSISIHN